VTDRGWKRAFDEPIPLPDGGELRTLPDAGRYADALPRSMGEREEWKTVTEVLLSAVEGREPVSLLRIALTLALQESGPTRGPQRC
jgi:nitroreductase